MSELITVKHHLQKHIIASLMDTEIARFRDLRPQHADTNLFSYHLKALMKSELVEKSKDGYTLSMQGLSYIDRVGTEKDVRRTQPEVIIMLLIQNSEGDVLLQQREKQPYIHAWALPYGDIHVGDMSLEKAAQRQANERLGLVDQVLKHAGICYIRVNSNRGTLSTTMAHVFTFNRDDIETSADVIWARPHKLNNYKLAPAVDQIIARGFFHDPFFFEEFEDTWPR